MKKLLFLILVALVIIVSASAQCFAIDTANERATIIIRIIFYDSAGALTTPSSFKYKLVDILSGTVITDTTTITPGSSSYDLTIPSASNRVLDSTKTFERRRLTVQWYSGVTLAGTDEYIYQVKNLNEVPFP